MIQLDTAGFIISNEDIDYKNCPKIITLNLNEFNATKDTILTNCNRIAQYMGATDNHQTQRTALQKNLAQTFITQLQGTFSTEIVQPVMNIPASYAAGYVSEKFAESLAKLAKSGKQEPTEDADPVKIKNKKKNKFTPTKRGDSSNQDEAGETNDENSPRKPLKKFTKNIKNDDNYLAKEYAKLPEKNKQEIQETVKKGILEGRLKIVANKANYYLNKYHKYEASNPILARTYLISGLILAKALTGGAIGSLAGGAGAILGFVGGFVKGIGDEVRGAIINYAVGDNIASFVNEGIEKYSPMIIKLDSSLSPQDAAMLASLALAAMLSGKEFMSFAKAMKGVNFASVKMINGKLTGVSEKSFTDTTSKIKTPKIKITEQTTKKFPDTKVKTPTKYPAHAEKIGKNPLKLSKAKITNAAKKLGFKLDKAPPFNSHGQPAFKKVIVISLLMLIAIKEGYGKCLITKVIV